MSKVRLGKVVHLGCKTRACTSGSGRSATDYTFVCESSGNITVKGSFVPDGSWLFVQPVQVCTHQLSEGQRQRRV